MIEQNTEGDATYIVDGREGAVESKVARWCDRGNKIKTFRATGAALKLPKIRLN